MADDAPPLPSIATMIGGVLQRVPGPLRPLFIAMAERLAAERYRLWAREASEPARSGLLACADREDEIGRRVERLYPDVASQQQELRASHPGLEEINASLFAGRPLAEQFAIQAAGERAGATVWRSFAQHAPDDATRATFLGCAELEEASAAYLESILSAG